MNELKEENKILKKDMDELKKKVNDLLNKNCKELFDNDMIYKNKLRKEINGYTNFSSQTSNIIIDEDVKSKQL